jgi:outer membrane biosynthesis protein TonB
MEDLGPNTAPLGQAAAALAPTYPQPAFSPQIATTPAPVAVADPFALPPLAAPLGMSSTGTAAAQPMAGSYAPSMVPAAPKRGVPLWFWPILLFTGVFGAAAAFFVFKQGQQPPAPVVIQMPPTPTTPTATEPKNDVPPPSSAEPATAASATPSAKVAANGPKTAGGTAPAATPKAGGGIDLGGLGPVAGGPNVGGGGPTPGAGGGGGLDSSSVQRVVASHQNGVKRTCWERGGGDSKASVNVTISAQVGPAGNVIGTSSSGDDPVVAKCIEGQVKTWMFSAPGSTTTVNIPFKFVRQ